MVPPAMGICPSLARPWERDLPAGLTAPTAPLSPTTPRKPALCRGGLGNASQGKGVTDRQRLPGAPVPALAGAPVRRDGARFTPGPDIPKSLPRGTPARGGNTGGWDPRLGALCRAERGGRASLLEWGQTDRGQRTDATFARSHVHPSHQSCPFPASRP